MPVKVVLAPGVSCPFHRVAAGASAGEAAVPLPIISSAVTCNAVPAEQGAAEETMVRLVFAVLASFASPRLMRIALWRLVTEGA